MTLINIGELVKNLTQDLKDAHREYHGELSPACGM